MKRTIQVTIKTTKDITQLIFWNRASHTIMLTKAHIPAIIPINDPIIGVPKRKNNTTETMLAYIIALKVAL